MEMDTDLATTYANATALRTPEEPSTIQPTHVYSNGRKRSWDECTTDDSPASSPNVCSNDVLHMHSNGATFSETPIESLDTPIETPGFWTCHVCNYNVNPIANSNCVYCSTARMGVNEGVEVAQSCSFLADVNSVNESNEKGSGEHEDSEDEAEESRVEGDESIGEADDDTSDEDSDSCSDYEHKVTPWTCIKCNHVNTKTKFKCGGCKGWKGGKRSKTKRSSAGAKKGVYIEPWTCDRCDFLNTRSKVKCSGCLRWRGGKRPVYKKKDDTEDEESEVEEVEEQEEGVKPWNCGKCFHLNSTATHKCSSCHGWRGGMMPPRKKAKRANDEYSNNDEDDCSYEENEESGEEGGLKPWSCIRCSHMNTKNLSRCSYCHGWKDGKLPPKKNKDEEAHIEPWTCNSCKYLNTKNMGKCANCYGWKDRKQVVNKADSSASQESNDSSDDEEEDDAYVDEVKRAEKETDGGMTPWTCVKCSNVNTNASMCSSCMGWKAGKFPLKKNQEEGIQITPWTCIGCNHLNTKSLTKCSNCGGWKDGKRPTKKSLDTADEASKPLRILSKKDYKPIFQINDHVYAPSWQGNGNKEDPKWYPGIVTGCTKSRKHGEYGPQRKYSVRFDEDQSELSDIEDYLVFSPEDYILECYQLSSETNWVGVVNKMDSASKDEWAKNNGWYEATIDGVPIVFPKLYDALKAYDAHVLEKHGEKAKLNRPDDIINESKVKSSAQTSKPQKINATAPQYEGVFTRPSGKYEARTYVKSTKTHHYMGTYTLEADAAAACDECLHNLGLTPVNFDSKKEYRNIRKQEIEERGIEVPYSEVKAYIDEKVKNVVAGANDDLKITKSKASQTSCKESSTPLPLSTFSSKYKGVSPHNATGKFQTRFSGIRNYTVGTYILAADAALAVDKCSHQLGLPAVNFGSEAEYNDARKRESDERGIKLPRSEVQAYLDSRVEVVIAAEATENANENVMDSANDDVQNSARKNTTSGRVPFYTDLSHSPRLKSRQHLIRSPKDVQTYASQYHCVSFDRGNKKFMATVTYKKKSHYLGRFDLAADAALMHDECARVLHDNSGGINFASAAEYGDARAKEVAERGIDVSCVNVSSLIGDRVDEFRSLVARNSAEDNPQSVVPVTCENTQGSCRQQEKGSRGRTKDDVDDSNAAPTVPVEQVSRLPAKPDRSKLISLFPHQTERLRFSIGTLVWWSVQTDALGGTYKEGSVAAIYFDQISRDLLYEIVSKLQPEPILLLEGELAYAPSSPVYISQCPEVSESTSVQDMLNKGEVLLEGNVLICRKIEEAWIYTVNIYGTNGMRLMDNVASDSVFYRKISE